MQNEWKTCSFFVLLPLSEIVIQCNIECSPFANAQNWNSMTSYFVSVDRSANTHKVGSCRCSCLFRFNCICNIRRWRQRRRQHERHPIFNMTLFLYHISQMRVFFFSFQCSFWLSLCVPVLCVFFAISHRPYLHVFLSLSLSPLVLQFIYSRNKLCVCRFSVAVAVIFFLVVIVCIFIFLYPDIAIIFEMCAHSQI